MNLLQQPELEESSSEDDLDYVPSDQDDVSCESGSGEDEATTEPTSAFAKTMSGRKKKTKKPRRHRNNKGLDDEALFEQVGVPEQVTSTLETKKRVDDLWSDFLADVSDSVKKEPSTVHSDATAALFAGNPNASSSTVRSDDSTSATLSVCAPSKVVVTQVYDFAGEDVIMRKEVDANSREAKYALSLHDEKQVVSSSNSTVTDNVTSTVTPADSTCSTAETSCGTPVPVKRASGLNSVMNMLSKKPKLSTLDKSKMDWQQYKQKHEISEELVQHNRGKDGYLERQEFLQRTDYRQFEVERNIRLSKRK